MLRHTLLGLFTDTWRRLRSRRLNERGLKSWHSGRLADATRELRAATELDPASGASLANLAMVCSEAGKYDEALQLLADATRRSPRHAGVRNNHGILLQRAGLAAAAAEQFRAAVELDPGQPEPQANLIRALLDCCEWDAAERWHAEQIADAERGGRAWLDRVQPFTSLFLPFSPQQRLQVARHHAQRVERNAGAPLGETRLARRRERTARLRIGYVSADFHDHATAHLTAGIYERHDRSRFEVFGYSLGHEPENELRGRIRAGCDSFADISQLSHRDAAQRIAADQVDILLDMKGFTGGGRPEIFALRPAPLQVSYLGYPGSSGAGYIDCFVTDAVASPPGSFAHFSEALAFLPGSYQPNDCDASIGAPVTRAESGLPGGAMVYCCFNEHAKINRATFACWMRILAQVPASVLWLLGSASGSEDRLRGAARSLGIDPARLIFAARRANPEHLARLANADLVLDTRICNAHTTGSDALWAGVPLLTCPGEHFAARVAASLVCAAGLPELAVASDAEYERTAVRLATTPDELSQLREKLKRARPACALFDTDRYVRNLEALYEACSRQIPTFL